MATIEENVKALLAKLEEAEKELFEKEEKERLEKERSWEHNVDVIQKNIKLIPPESLYQKGGFGYLQPFMTSVLECLQRLNERVQSIEEQLKK